MKNTFSKTITASTIAMLVLSMLAAFPLVRAAPTVWVDPATVSFDTNDVSIGDYFIVQVKVSNPDAWNLMMFQVMIKYKQAYLAPSYKGANIWSYPSGLLGVAPPESWDTNYVFYGSSGTIGNPSIQTLDGTWDGIMLGETLLADKALNAGQTYIVAQFNFTIIAVPSKYQTLESLLDINHDQTFFYDSVGPLLVGPDAGITNGQYTLDWAPPPSPQFGFDPSSFLFEKWWTHVGTTFDVALYLYDLNAAWDATNATVDIAWSPTGWISLTGTVVDPAWTVSSVTPGVDSVNIFVDAYMPSPPSGDVLIATLTFTIDQQGTYPDPDGEVDIEIVDSLLYNHVNEIATLAPINCHVTIEAFLALAQPWYEVVPPLVEKGPEPVIGQEFDVAVKINDLQDEWFAVGLQFKMTYDPDLLEFVSATEGPFMANPVWNWYGTFFVATVSGYPNPGVNIGSLLLPNGVGEWDMTEFPNTENPAYDNTVAIIRFRVVKQIYPYTFECPLNLVSIGGVYGVDKNGAEILFDEAAFIHGWYRVVTTPLPGMGIDLYGGAMNGGYGAIPFPAPYGGQGPNMPMDLVVPQSLVGIFCNLTYNYWPVQQKDIGFEVEGPYDHIDGEYIPKLNHFILYKGTARTDVDGVAYTEFRMPWPCEDPDSLLGVWKITATGKIGDTPVSDTLYFYYDYMVHIWKVTTDKYSYAHCETVTVTVKYGTHAMQWYPALFSVVIIDELSVPFAMALIETEVGGAIFCQYNNFTIRAYLHIPKFAYAGYAHIEVNCFNKDPTEGGFAWCPQYTPEPEIFIQPY